MSGSYGSEEVIRILEKRKLHQYPSFFLYGSSTSARAEMAIKITNTMKQNQSIQFVGSAKSFSILMPYFHDEKGADQFIEHLKESISVAQDYYEKFSGIIIIELNQQWGNRELNNSLEKVFDFLSKFDQVCYVLLFPANEENVKSADFFRELSGSGNWIKVFVSFRDPIDCTEHFKRIIEEKGMILSDLAEVKLLEVLKERSEEHMDNLSAVEQLAERILFEKSLFKNKKKVVDENDVTCMSGMIQRKKTKIGFANATR